MVDTAPVASGTEAGKMSQKFNLKIQLALNPFFFFNLITLFFFYVFYVDSFEM